MAQRTKRDVEAQINSDTFADLGELREMIEASRASGVRDRSVAEILAEARREAEASGPLKA